MTRDLVAELRAARKHIHRLQAEVDRLRARLPDEVLPGSPMPGESFELVSTPWPVDPNVPRLDCGVVDPDPGLTEAGRYLREVARTGNENVEPFGFVPCAREHESGHVCIRPDGHPALPTEPTDEDYAAVRPGVLG